MKKNWKELSGVLQRILDDSTDTGEECGCQLAIYEHGQLVVDLASGYDGPEKSHKVTQESLFPIFSCGKGVVATALHRLVEKGLVSYDTRIADVWPEYGCNGKEDTRLWHFMTHRSGMHVLPKTDGIRDLADWTLMTTKLAEGTPKFAPGTRCVYNGITYAWNMGETAARVAGKPFRQIVIDEVLAPLGIQNDFYFGTTDEADKRFAPIDRSAFPGESSVWTADFINDAVIRHAVIPSANGVCNARALARHYAALIGEVDGVRLLKPDTVTNATWLRRAANDPIGPEVWSKFGLGYALCGYPAWLGEMFGQGGAAGSEGFAIQSEDVAVAFTKNRPLPSHPVHPIRDRISDALELKRRHW